MTNTFTSQSLPDWLFYLESQHPKDIELGLDRVVKVAESGQLTDLNAGKVVLVAGTNGKGTTIRFMETYLLSLGLSVGVYSSPHIFHYHERVRINGQHLADSAHVAAFKAVEQMREDTPLTYFEFGTLAAYHLFKQATLDVVLVEVGLGGRLDATNILNHDLAIVTSLGLDHTDWLGDTIEQIGYEKAGIFKANKPAVVGLTEPPHSVMEQAKDLNVSELKIAGQDYAYQRQNDSWSYQSQQLSLTQLSTPTIPIQNVASAITALGLLKFKVDEDRVNQVLENLTLVGRMQFISDAPVRMVDVAHNEHAIEFLSSTVNNNPLLKNKPVRAVVAMMTDKDIKGTLSAINADINHWYVAALPDNPRAAKGEVLAQVLEQLGAENIQLFESVGAAWQQAKLEQSKDELLLGFGSFYTVADIFNEEQITEVTL